MDVNNLCTHCMREIKGEQSGTCPYCGKERESWDVKHQLKPLTILQGKYLIGDVLGEGGFGITYVGFDLNLEMRVAIKEFYPNGYATREANVTSQMTIYSGLNSEAVLKWRDSFLKEARSLAKCANLPGVVGVKDFFQENNTAYIVQEFLEGKTLKEYAKQKGGKIPVEQLMTSMEPVFKALAAVHKQGIIHRDISPDNIMCLDDGQMKLLDFGAARDFTDGGEKSLSVLLKPGYAPEEQYRTKGKQGPWSDIYALAGTIYKCLTSETPPEAMERMRNDTITWPSQMGVNIPAQMERALQKAMQVYAENRYQTMEEFYADIYTNKGSVPANVGTIIGGIDSSTNTSGTTGNATNGVMTAGIVSQASVSVDATTVAQAFQQAKTFKSIVDNKKLLYAIICGSVALVVLIGIITLPVALKGKKSNQSDASAVSDTSNVSNLEVSASAQVDESSVSSQVQEETTPETPEAEVEAVQPTQIVHDYELYIEDCTWNEASQKCKDRGGHLATITSYEDYCVVEDYLNYIQAKTKDSKIQIWLGGYYDYNAGAYCWITGEDFSYQNWIQNEPSLYDASSGTYEDCICYAYNSNYDTWGWNDVPGDISSWWSGHIAYLCEWDREVPVDQVSDGASVQTSDAYDPNIYERYGVKTTTVENYQNALDLRNWRLFTSHGEQTYWVPVGLYNVVSEGEGDDTLESITFQGSNGSSVEFYWEYGMYTYQEVFNVYSNQLTEPYVIKNKSEGDNGRFVITGYDQSGTSIIYCLGSVQNGYLSIMYVTYPRETDENDKIMKDYVIECLYRGCGFSGSQKPIRTYQEYLEALNE